MTCNIVYIPFHDWRKISKEGNRTRDAHFIDKFRSNNDIKKLLILNRPITYAELLLKKKKVSRKITGKIIFESKGAFLYKIDEKTYVIDVFLNQNFKQILKGRSWFFDAFKDKHYIKFYNQCIRFLKLENTPIISANIFSSNFILKNHQNSKVLFDAWDNFYLMPGLNSIKAKIFDAYKSFSNNAPVWITNSKENKSFFIDKYGVNKIKIIKNGVDFSKFTKGLPIPKDLLSIKEKNLPIVGFGGKITHLFDVNLFNYITKNNKNYNFVIIGQILNKKVYSKINISDNVYYLGDKNYEIYPNYLSNFDVGIIPYRIGVNQHGGDSIKVYEYISIGLPVIGTRGNGLQDMEEYIYIADSKEDFSEMIKNVKALKELSELDHSWKSKEKELLSILNNTN